MNFRKVANLHIKLNGKHVSSNGYHTNAWYDGDHTLGTMATTRWYEDDQRLVRGLPHVGMRATTIWSLCDQKSVSL